MNGVVVLLNPASGGVHPGQSGGNIEQLFAARNVQAEIKQIGGHRHAAELARQAVSQGCNTIIAGGGDGTIGAVASALVDTDGALGVLPLGTLNHFARDLHLPMDVPGAIDVIARRNIARIDVAEVNGRTFVNNSSIGIYPNIVVLRERERRLGRSKPVAFLRATLAMLKRFPFWSVRVHANGRSIVENTPFVFVGNNEYELQGFEIGTRACLDRGRLCVYVATRTSRLGFLWMAFTALFGRLDKRHRLQTMCIDEAWIETRGKRVRVSTDGEVTLMRNPLHYRARPLSLKVIVP